MQLNNATRTGARTRTFVKAGAGLLAAACASLLVLSAFAIVQDSADRTH
jgi:hypothetical protein